MRFDPWVDFATVRGSVVCVSEQRTDGAKVNALVQLLRLQQFLHGPAGSLICRTGF